MSVLAIILTYNSPETVVRCVRAVRAQGRAPEHVLVVDNASGIPAQQCLGEAGLADERVSVHRTDANLGPAGGYAEGLRWFLSSGYDVAWVMDDDCEPDHDVLEALEARAARQPTPSVILPDEVDADGVSMTNLAWCGVWIPRDAVEKAGLPRAEFFWWMEDTEYLRHRMRGAAVPVVREPRARVVHRRERREGPTPVWKYYYETRNSTYMYTRLQRGNLRAMRRWAWRMARRLGGILVQGDMRAAKVGAFVQGLHDGVRGRLGKRFPVT